MFVYFSLADVKYFKHVTMSLGMQNLSQDAIVACEGFLIEISKLKGHPVGDEPAGVWRLRISN